MMKAIIIKEISAVWVQGPVSAQIVMWISQGKPTMAGRFGFV
jgi:hypothetical protein